MMVVPSAEHRPLKRQKLGPPDVYPQDAKQREVSIFFPLITELTLLFKLNSLKKSLVVLGTGPLF